MTPGPTLIVKAPGCKTLLRIDTINSGNDIHAKYWTDAKMEAPMLPDFSKLLQNYEERVLFWRDDVEIVGRYGPGRDNPPKYADWYTLCDAVEPSETYYFVALARGMGNTPDRLRYLRKRIWWCANNKHRKSNEIVPFTAEHRDNMEKIIQMLSLDLPQERVVIAELWRELGEFEKAEQTLDFELPEKVSEGFKGLVEQIRRLAKAKMSKVDIVQSMSCTCSRCMSNK